MRDTNTTTNMLRLCLMQVHACPGITQVAALVALWENGCTVLPFNTR